MIDTPIDSQIMVVRLCLTVGQRPFYVTRSMATTSSSSAAASRLSSSSSLHSVCRPSVEMLSTQFRPNKVLVDRYIDFWRYGLYSSRTSCYTFDLHELCDFLVQDMVIGPLQRATTERLREIFPAQVERQVILLLVV